MVYQPIIGYLMPNPFYTSQKLLIIPIFDGTGMIYMHWVPTGQTVNI